MLCALLVGCGGGGGGGGGGSPGSGDPSSSNSASSSSNPTTPSGPIGPIGPSAPPLGIAQGAIDSAAAIAAEVTARVSKFVKETYDNLVFPDGTRVIGPVALAGATASSSAPITTSKNWSDLTLWGGVRAPAAGEDVVIPAGTEAVLDVTPPNLGAITVNGTLRFAAQNVNLTATKITIGLTGALKIGSPTAPFLNKAVITLTEPKLANIGAFENVRGITVNGGKLEIYAASPQPVWTQLNDHANAGTKAFMLKEAVNWKAGDTVAVGPSDFYGVNPTERLTLAANANGAGLNTTAALDKFRWGKMQYMTDAGLSLAPGAYTPHVLPAPTQLDQRAAVANLSRNVVIQGADDAAWQNDGFGAHVMVMDIRSKVFVDGVEFRRVGQAGRTARYPFHWHMLSYDANGNHLGQATGHEIRNSAIWQSAQRCIVIHGTNGVAVRNNICQDIRGHAFFLEDAVERDNTLEGNLALKIRTPETKDQLLVHEGNLGAPSGFWLTNPDNTIRQNVAADVVGHAFWNAFPESGVGLSRNAKSHKLVGTPWANLQMNPAMTQHGKFDNNVAYSTGRAGINSEEMLQGGSTRDNPRGDDKGNFGAARYRPTIDGRPYDINGWYNPNDRTMQCSTDQNSPVGCTKSSTARATFSRSTIYKTNEGYSNRINAPDYPEWVMADVVSNYARGAGDDGVFMRGLFIGKSLNNLSPYPADASPQAMFATYHSTFQMRDNTMANIAYVDTVAGQDPERTSSGVFKTDDYYVSQLERGSMLNANNRLINAFPGSRFYSSNLYSNPPTGDATENFSLAGAIWDPYGYWGNKGFYWTYDTPFFTSGGNCAPALFPTANGKNAAGKYNGQSCGGEFYGLTNSQDTDFLRAGSNNAYWPVDVERLDCNLADFSTSSVGKRAQGCRWIVGSGWDSWKLGNMRGAAVRQGGSFRVMFPDPQPGANAGRNNSGGTNPIYTAGITRGTMVNADGNTVGISIPKVVSLYFSNVQSQADSFVVAISFDGSKTPVGVMARGTAAGYRGLLPPNPRPNDYSADEVRLRTKILSLASSKTEVENDPSGSKMWQDKPNNLIWVKVVGNLKRDDWYRIVNFTAPFAQNPYNDMSVYIKHLDIANN